MNTNNYSQKLLSEFSDWSAILDYIFDNKEDLMDNPEFISEVSLLYSKIENLPFHAILWHLEDLINDYGYCRIEFKSSDYEGKRIINIYVNGKQAYAPTSLEDLHNDFLSEKKNFFRNLIKDCLFYPLMKEVKDNL